MPGPGGGSRGGGVGGGNGTDTGSNHHNGYDKNRYNTGTH